MVERTNHYKKTRKQNTKKPIFNLTGFKGNISDRKRKKKSKCNSRLVSVK